MVSRLVLASASPRREQLLEQLGLNFTIVPSGIEEENYKDLSPVEMVNQLALAKVKKVSELVEDTIIIGADTVVIYGDKLLGKPEDEKEARDMLKKLSGTRHRVLTGVALLSTGNGKSRIEHDTTEVFMRELEDKEIEGYIRTGEPMDKAGAYGIQGMGGMFVEKIEGSFFTVMGLPIHKLVLMLREFSIEVV